MNEHWQSALEDVRARLSAENFETWLGPIRFDGFDGRRVRIRIPNRFYAEWIRTHYLDLLLDSLRHHSALDAIEVDWKVDERLGEPPRREDRREDGHEDSRQEQSVAGTRAQTGVGSRNERVNELAPLAPLQRPSEPPPSLLGLSGPQSRPHSNLNPKYRFETFVVGPSNQLAHAAAMAASSTPGQRYNPLFIYGGVGLGKTHLVNAVGHRVLLDHTGARILYVSAERFTNEFIWALQNHRINEFRDRYRNGCDVLLMDDIQFLASREQTQEEFFHTFNALYHSDKQIVVSSDVYPQQIGKMEERLISRFQWGMVADIQAPELDTRIAIVHKKAEQEGIALQPDVAHFLAQAVKSNVRELEGTLLRLAVKAELLKRPIDLEFAREALRVAMPKSRQVTTVDDIQRAVCEYFNIRLSELKSHRRHRSVAYPRMIAMYLCRQRLKTSYTELGERFGGKDHTTVMSAVKKIEGRMGDDDRELLDCVEAVEYKLQK